MAERKHHVERVRPAPINRNDLRMYRRDGGPPAPPWGERDRRPSPALASGPALSNGAALTGREMNMWRNEGWQFETSFNLTAQH